MNLLRKIKQAILCNRLFEPGDSVLIGVSGGPDSMALMHLLIELRHELGVQLYVGHLNHNLRKDSSLDENFVRVSASKLNLKFISASIHIKKIKGRSSLEESARRARFDFLIRTAQKLKANKIALAHTQDDLAETVLMRILRGTGLDGLRSILPRRLMGGMMFMRPLLSINKKELLVFLKKKKIPFRTDSTNKDTDFFRNKIRLKLLPLLQKEYQPNIREVLANLAEVSAIDYDFLESAGKRLFNKAVKASPNPKIVRLNTKVLEQQHPALKRLLIREALARLEKSAYSFSLKHTKQVENLLKQKRGKHLLLPNGIIVIQKSDHMEFAMNKNLNKSSDTV